MAENFKNLEIWKEAVKLALEVYKITIGSIFEVRSHLSIAFGLAYITQLNFDKIDNSYDILVRRLNAFISSIKRPN